MKQNKKDVRGFTLIELLAVIVVLAVVMLIAIRAVLPRMESARKQVFALEANELIQAAQTYVANSSLTGTVLVDGKDKTTCVEVADLVDGGYSTADKTKYKGKVIISGRINEQGTLIYLYQVWLGNKNGFMVNGKGQKTVGEQIVNTDVEEKDVETWTTSFESVQDCK